MLFTELAAEPDKIPGLSGRREAQMSPWLLGCSGQPGPGFCGIDPGGGGAELQGSKHPEPRLKIAGLAHWPRWH